MSMNVGTLQDVICKKLHFDNSLSINIFHHQGRVESNQDPVGDAGRGQMVKFDAVAPTVNVTCLGGTVETGKCKNWRPGVANSYLQL